MNSQDIRAGRTYTDGHGTVRRVVKITNLRNMPGNYDEQSVVYTELSGLNRGMTHSLPVSKFAAFAARLVVPKNVDETIRAAGLNGYAMDARTRELCLDAAQGQNVIVPSQGDHVGLERLVGRGLADRVGPRAKADRYHLCPALLEAAQITLRAESGQNIQPLRKAA